MTDYAESVAFLAWLFADTEGAVELRAIRSEGGAVSVFTRDPETVATFCRRHDGPGRGLYLGAATRTAGIAKGDREHCLELPALWSDIDCVARSIDQDEAISALLSLPHPPSCIVDSGRGLHPWWKLKEPLDLSDPKGDEAVIAVLRQLAGVCGGDLKVCDIARVMRLPGTLNTKGAEPVLCRVIYGGPGK